MKEAAGEANITVITIVLIAIVLVVGTVVVRSVLSNTKKSSCCNTIGGYWQNGDCYADKTMKSKAYGAGYSVSTFVDALCPDDLD